MSGRANQVTISLTITTTYFVGHDDPAEAALSAIRGVRERHPTGRIATIQVDLRNDAHEEAHLYFNNEAEVQAAVGKYTRGKY